MDLRMPDIDGLEAIRRLRTAGSTAAIVAVTASGLARAESDARDVGVDAFVRKPYREADLLETIGELLGVRYSADASQALTDAGAAARDETSTVFPGAMDGLPAVLVDQLRAAALQGRAKRLEQLADEAGAYSQAAAAAIRVFAVDFRYDALVAALEAQTLRADTHPKPGNR
jgi:CheY-like chemotaxis protein